MTVHFDEESHTYTNTETGEELISVTTLIGKYEPEFDTMKHATRVAEREGLPVEFIIEEWERVKDKACEFGSEIHNAMEDFVGEGIRDEKYASYYASYEKWSAEVFAGMPTKLAEKQIFDFDYNVAGTADLIYENKTSFFVGDFKTNKRFRYTSTYNDYFSEPLDHLSICEFNIYALQMSIYAYMYEKATGKKCKGLVLFYRLKNNTWHPVHCNYMKCEAKNLLEHYKSSD